MNMVRTLFSSALAGAALFLLQPVATAQAQPDLSIRLLSAPSTIRAGHHFPVRVGVRNGGTRVAHGTNSAGTRGYMVDLVLSRDLSVPGGFATYSPSYHEDVLIRGGRHSRTRSIRPGGNWVRAAHNHTIPSNTPPGRYFICAKVDPGGRVAESNEHNNHRCRRVIVRR